MPKPLVNNKIVYQNIHGRIIQHDLYLDQGVQQGDSPTFANIQLTGNATIEGNLYVYGNTTILDSIVLEFEDNIVLVNRLETGSGVTLNQAGFEIERGSLENYRFVFNEADDTFRIGPISNTQAVATREDNPLAGGFMVWNGVQKRIDSTNTLSIDLVLQSTTNSTSSTTGCLVLNGGLGIQKDTHLDGKLYLQGSNQSNKSMIWTDTTTNTLNITSVQDINFTPVGKLQIPYDKQLTFGSTDQSVSVNSLTRDINIVGKGDVSFTLEPGKRISLPNQIPITFSTQNEKVYTDSSNNMVVEGSQDVSLIPGPNKKVYIPVNTPIAFSNPNQQISANLNNDLAIIAGNNIFLTPGQSLNVRIPTDSGVKFGGSGNQLIYADSNNFLNILSTGDMYITPNPGSKINVPSNIPITFGGPTQYIMSNTSGNVTMVASGTTSFTNSGIIITNTDDASAGTNGSIYTLGGIGSVKRVFSETGISVDSNDSNALQIRQNSGNISVFRVNNTSSGNVNVYAGNGFSAEPSLKICSQGVNDAGSIIQLISNFDATFGYEIGRGSTTLNDGRSFTLNIPSHSAYASLGVKPKFVITTNNHTRELFAIETDTGNVTSTGTFGLINSQEATNATTASFVVYGGLGVAKNIYTNGRYTSETSSTEAILVRDTSSTHVFRLDTVNKQAVYNAYVAINQTVGQSLTVNNSLTIDEDNHQLRTDYQISIKNTSDTTNSSNGSLVVDGGVAIQKKLRVTDTVFFNNGLNMNNTKITNIQTPSDPLDAANKAYVDLVKQGLYVKDSVKAATQTAGNLLNSFDNGSVVDGYTLQTGDRILVKDQLDPIENGIYIVGASGAPQRSLDLQDGSSASGVFVFIQSGILNVSLGFICNSESGDDIIGTNTLSFTQFTGLGQVVAGDGVSKTFNQIDVNVDNSSLEIFADALRIKNTVVGTGMTGGSGSPLQTITDQSHVTKLGPINTGTWQASTVQVVYGGTGRTQFTSGSIIYGNGTGALSTNSKLFYNSAQTRLGLGTNLPTEILHIQSTDNTILLLNSNSDGISNTAKPEVRFSHTGVNRASVGVSRNNNDYGNNVHGDAIVISNLSTNSDSNIQFVTNQQARMTIFHNGNVGINTSVPTYTLQVAGTLTTTELNHFQSTVNATSWSNGSVLLDGGIGITKDLRVNGYARVYHTAPSTNLNNGALIVDGGLTVKANDNAANFGNGGSLTVAGGASIGLDLYVGGNINGSGSSSSTFAYLTLTATNEAINITSGALVTFGGITIQSTTNSSSVTNGGSFLVAGGAAVRQDLYVGGNQFNSGYINFYSTNENVINLYTGTSKNWSINKDITTNDLSLSRYDSSGTLIEKTFNVNNTTGTITFSNSTPSYSPTSASFVLVGGASVCTTRTATSLTSGGGITNLGGQSISKNLLVGGDVRLFSTTQSTSVSSGALIVDGGVGVSKNVNIDGSLDVKETVTFVESFNFKGNGLFDTIQNTSGSQSWNYLGQINSTNGYTQVELTNGVNNNLAIPGTYTLKFLVSVSGTNVSFSHTQSGNLTFSSTDKADCVVFKDSSDLHLFIATPSTSTTSIRIYNQIGTPFEIVDEGNSSEPSGATSGYDNSWTTEYRTNKESNLAISFGDLTVEGTVLKVCDNLPIVGYNNANTTASRDIGIMYQRFQTSNDAGSGDIVSGESAFIDSLPSQSGATLYQIRFSNLANSTDNYYNGWWVKMGTGPNINQVRRIVAYNASMRVAQLETPWSTQNPTTGDTVFVYGSTFVAGYFDENQDRYKLAYASLQQSGVLQNHGDVDLQVKNLFVSDTTPSVNATTGSIYTLGGISINNVNNSDSSTRGGSFTTLGGASVRKTLYVGDNIGVGSSGFTPQETLHINQSNSTVRLQNNTLGYSYIDFVESSTNNRYGILNDTNQDIFSLTWTSTGNNPLNANKALTVNSAGYVGINTTSNINSPFAITRNTLVSTDSDNGYIGMIAGSTNTNDATNGARMLLYGNTSGNNSGDAELHTSTTGSFKVFTNNDTEQFKIDKSGVTYITCTSNTKSRTSGALIVSGGVAVGATENSQSSLNGGSLTVAGGASIAKDIFIGGNLYITGNLNAGGSVLTPTITFSNTQGAAITSSFNTNVLTVSNEATLSFAVEVTPVTGSQNCQFEFSLPYRTNALINRGELIATCSGYTDDTEIIPVFNCICVGSNASTRGLVKFQSVSSGIHYFTILCRYTMA